MIEETVRDAGHIDGLINNFCTSDPGQDLDFAHTDPEVFFSILKRNLCSVYMGSQAAVRYMAARGNGSIVNISSVGGTVPDISQVAYGTGKAAINCLTRLIAVHEARNGIRCNAVLPGMTATDAIESKLSPAFKELFRRHNPSVVRPMG